MLRDLINKFEKTISLIESSSNAQVNLLNIVNFYSYCEKNFSIKIYSGFIYDFIPYLIDIFKYHNLNFIDPEYILKANQIFNLSITEIKTNTDVFLKDVITSQKNLKLQLIKAYLNIGEVENGIELIKEYSGIEFEEDNNSNNNKKIVKGKNNKVEESSQSLRNIDTYDSFYLFKVMNEINKEIDRLKSYSDDTINILFNIKDFESTISTGFVLQCSVSITEDINIKSFAVAFENAVDYKDNDINDSIYILTSNFEQLLKINNLKPPKNKLFKIKFENQSGIYRGGSFISGILLLMFIRYYNSLNKISRLEVSKAIAFTGAIDQWGNFRKLPINSLKAKISSAYFSWIRQLVIPEENLNDANEILNELRSKYPKKTFMVVPAKSIQTLITESHILKEERKPLANHIFNKYKNVSLFIIFVLIIFASIISFKTIYKPTIKPLPKTSGESYLIYTPDRDVKWLFQNHFQENDDTIQFGEVGVGDMWYPVLEFWNNSHKAENFKFVLEGKDKDDFEIVWREEPKQEMLPIINPDIIQRMYLKFRPLVITDTGHKEAKLKISNENDSKEIFLKGKSGIYDGGYSLAFNKPEDYLIISNNTNIIGKEFIIDFWIKPIDIIKGLNYSETIGFLVDENGTNSKFNMGINPDSTLYLILNNKKIAQSFISVNTTNKIFFKKWNHIQIIFKNNQRAINLNETFKNFAQEIKINSISDYIYIGYNDFPDRPDKRKRDAAYLNFHLADFKIYGEDKDILLDYRFEETNFEAVYDLSNSEIWGRLKGGITRKLDYPHSLKTLSGKESIRNNNNALEISDRGLMLCTKNFFSSKSSFTICFDAFLFSKEKNNYKYLFSLSHPDTELSFTIDSSFAKISLHDKFKSYKKFKIIPFIYYDKWHRYTLQYSLEDKSITIYLDTMKLTELDSLEIDFDISKWNYGIGFGNYTFFYSPRPLTTKILLDDIYIYKQKIPIEEALLKDNTNALSIWDFENIKSNLVLDKVNQVPAFLWHSYKLISKE